MKWYGICGSWRNTNEKIKKDVDNVVRKIIKNDGGIVTGGALGVDYFATQVVLDMNKAKQIKIFLPIKLSDFCKHYQKRAEEVITKKQADMIVKQLKEIAEKNEDAIFDEHKYKEANIESYYARNTKIVESSDVLYAFQVNDSKGTQDAIDKAKRLGKKVFVKKYRI